MRYTTELTTASLVVALSMMATSAFAKNPAEGLKTENKSPKLQNLESVLEKGQKGTDNRRKSDPEPGKPVESKNTGPETQIQKARNKKPAQTGVDPAASARNTSGQANVEPAQPPQNSSEPSLNKESDQTKASDPIPNQLYIFFGGALLILFAGWGFKRYRKHMSGQTNMPLNHIQSMQVGFKHQLSVVRVGDKTLLLGLTKEDINLLADMSDDKAFAQADQPQKPQGDSTWSNVFEQAKNNLPDALTGQVPTGQSPADGQTNGASPAPQNRDKGGQSYADYRRHYGDNDAGRGSRNGHAARNMDANGESADVRAGLEKLKRQGGGLT